MAADLGTGHVGALVYVNVLTLLPLGQRMARCGASNTAYLVQLSERVWGAAQGQPHGGLTIWGSWPPGGGSRGTPPQTLL